MPRKRISPDTSPFGGDAALGGMANWQAAGLSLAVILLPLLTNDFALEVLWPVAITATVTAVAAVIAAAGTRDPAR